ncbi:MAG: mechanosensitive ion channel family protein [Cyanobacteria bacterium Co-bin13]|nr:mechanosensitive ion channel family protein [Cyanobacteria bacterium Co-bin13]
MNALLTRVQESLLDLVGGAVKLLPAILLALIILLITRYAVRGVNQVSRRFGRRVLKSRSLQLLFSQACRIGTWVLGVVIAAVVAFPDLRLGDLIGLLGLGSVAIGFAFQDIFKNFLAGILLLIEEPFQLGDQIVVNDYEGIVESIQIRTTHILNYTGELVEIPNSIVFTNAVRVLTAKQCRRTDLDIGVDYTTPLPLAKEAFLAVLNSGIEGVLEEPAPEVDVVGFGDSSIDFKVRYWTRPQIADVRRTRSRVAMALKEACDRNQISIPYPIRTVHFFDQRNFEESKPLNGARPEHP